MAGHIRQRYGKKQCFLCTNNILSYSYENLQLMLWFSMEANRKIPRLNKRGIFSIIFLSILSQK